MNWSITKFLNYFNLRKEEPKQEPEPKMVNVEKMLVRILLVDGTEFFTNVCGCSYCGRSYGPLVQLVRYVQDENHIWRDSEADIFYISNHGDLKVKSFEIIKTYDYFVDINQNNL